MQCNIKIIGGNFALSCTVIAGVDVQTKDAVLGTITVGKPNLINGKQPIQFIVLFFKLFLLSFSNKNGVYYIHF